ncbi:MAG: hypothetical protein HRT53_17970 [Colwellia sp.]|nr:hypothetical protein [Colwellia sp.]
MNKLIYICLICMTFGAYAGDGSISPSVQVCDIDNRITSESLTKDHYKNSLFLLSDKYCIRERVFRSNIDVNIALLPEAEEVYRIRARYRKAYGSLNHNKIR